MGKKFTVTFEVTAEIELDEEVFSRATDEEFRRYFYTLDDEREVVEHLAYQMVRYHQDISEIEGWMMPKDKAKLLSLDWDVDEVEEG